MRHQGWELAVMDFLVDYLKKPEWGSQHRWRRAIFNTMSRMGLTGVHALPLNRRWVEIHRRRMPLKGLDQLLAGMNLVHISVLNYSPVVWERYLILFFRLVNACRPDGVV